MQVREKCVVTEACTCRWARLYDLLRKQLWKERDGVYPIYRHCHTLAMMLVPVIRMKRDLQRQTHR